MGAVAEIDSWRYLSLNQLSQVFGIARETVKSRIDFARIKPAGERKQHQTYDIREVYQAIREFDQSRVDTSDPDKLPPKERRDWYEGNLAKKKDELAEGKLVDAEQVRVQMAELIKPGIQLMETIPDILERDYRLEPEAIDDIELRIKELRNQWADEIEKQCLTLL